MTTSRDEKQAKSSYRYTDGYPKIMNEDDAGVTRNTLSWLRPSDNPELLAEVMNVRRSRFVGHLCGELVGGCSNG
jgi:hypothetical protein